ncbi:hypothetical protein, partial [Ileibacterium valens]|uniref:hypothetical protein n=1 Tax=Ileibacterium valens TaxID=1862668 RepID=UPI00272ACC77
NYSNAKFQQKRRIQNRKNEGIRIGKNEGIEIGRNQQLRKIAVKLLASGFSREAVANFLEISNAHLELVLSEEDK